MNRKRITISQEASDRKNYLSMLEKKKKKRLPGGKKKRNLGESTQTLASKTAILWFGKVFPISRRSCELSE